MDAAGSLTRYDLLKTAAAMSLPKTLPCRLTLLGSMLVLVSVLIPNVKAGGLLMCVGLVALLLAFVVAFVAAVAPRRSEQRLGALASARYGMTRLARALGWAVIGLAGISAALYAMPLASGFFAFLAISGHGESSSAGPLENAAVVVGAAVLAILLWPPQLFFRLQLDIDGSGSAQLFLLRLITVTACGLTGINIMLLHFDKGPLSSIGIGPLIAGTIGAIVLLAPLYRSLARACWRRGIARLIDLRALRRRWSDTLAELRHAVERSAVHHTDQVAPTPARARHNSSIWMRRSDH
jgi:hypothetical protein